MSARFAHSVGALLDPNECFFDCSCKTPLSLMQVNVQLRFLVGIGLINEITLPTTCRWHPGLSRAQGGRRPTLFLQQQSVVSPQVGWVHDLSSVGGNLAYGPEFYTCSNPVSAAPGLAAFPFVLVLAPLSARIGQMSGLATKTCVSCRGGVP